MESPAALATAPPNPAPMMDVVPPPVPLRSSGQEAVKPAPPPDAEDPATPAPPVATSKEPPKTKKLTPPKKAGNGTGTAIVATVIIVLGLAALATYAFLKTQN